MSNEIWHSYDSALVLYALVYDTSGEIWDVGDTAFEAVGTWNDARAGECDIAMTAAGDMHFADFPTGITDEGLYYIEVREREGASPDSDDPIVAQGTILWSGEEEITLFGVMAGIGQVLNNFDDTDPTVITTHVSATGRLITEEADC